MTCTTTGSDGSVSVKPLSGVVRSVSVRATAPATGRIAPPVCNEPLIGNTASPAAL
jgi:hypothetical protein